MHKKRQLRPPPAPMQVPRLWISSLPCHLAFDPVCRAPSVEEVKTAGPTRLGPQRLALVHLLSPRPISVEAIGVSSVPSKL